MVVDTSALLAILFNEEEGPALRERLLEEPQAHVSTASLVELSLVLVGRHGEQSLRALDGFLADLGVIAQPFTPTQAGLAASAFVRFGKGRHKARLNLGDCFAYALAKDRDEPLLYKGDDFAQTDIRSALP